MRTLRRVDVLVMAALCLAPTAALAAGDAEHGKSLFKTFCAGCHGPDGRGGAHTFMPHVDTLTRKGYIEQVPDDYLALVILEGGVSVGRAATCPPGSRSCRSRTSRTSSHSFGACRPTDFC